MSSYTKELENGRIVTYGHCETFGYHINVYGAKDEEGNRNILIHESSLSTNMSNGKMIELMDIFKLPESHIEEVAMNVPIT